MRYTLEAHDGERLRFRGTVERFGAKRGWRGRQLETILFSDVRLVETGELMTDHIWFTSGAWSLGLIDGDTVEFDARVDSYEKGYKGGRAERLGLATYDIDYHLERPSKVVVVSRKLEAPIAPDPEPPACSA